MLLDSNIIIYSAQPENEFLRQLIAERALYWFTVNRAAGFKDNRAGACAESVDKSPFWATRSTRG
jgi:hypothetical protein